MDSARNAASEASKLLSRDPAAGTDRDRAVEPLAGVMGAGTPGDPYDAGNRYDGTTTAENRGGYAEPGANRAAELDAPTNAATGAAAPDSGAQRHQKQQGADRPNERPDREERGAIRETKDNAESAMDLGRQETEDDGAEGESGSGGKEKGSGLEWVKSSGMAADGGDFDATKPGAGKEAGRLLEEKGIHIEGNTGPPQPGPDGSAGGKDKPGVGDKIKDALHIGKH